MRPRWVNTSAFVEEEEEEGGEEEEGHVEVGRRKQVFSEGSRCFESFDDTNCIDTIDEEEKESHTRRVPSLSGQQHRRHQSLEISIERRFVRTLNSNADRYSLLFNAVTNLDLLGVEALVVSKGLEVSDSTRKNGVPVLHLLFDFGNGVMCDARNTHKRAAICSILVKSFPLAAKMVLDSWSKTRIDDEADDYVVQAELRRPSPNLGVVQALLEACPEIAYLCNESTGEYPIHVACKSLELSVVRTVLASDPGSSCLRNNKTLEYPLHVVLNAAKYASRQRERLQSQKRFCQQVEQDDEEEGYNQDKELDLSFSYQAVVMQETMLQLIDTILNQVRTTPVSARSLHQKSPPHLGKLESCDTTGRSILHYAAAFHSPRVVTKVLSISPRLVRCMDRNMDTPLHIACRRVSTTETLCSIEVFYVLANEFFHEWRNKAWQSPSMLLVDDQVKQKLTSRFAVSSPGARRGRPSASVDSLAGEQTDEDVSPPLRFFGKIMRSLSTDDHHKRQPPSSLLS